LIVGIDAVKIKPRALGALGFLRFLGAEKVKNKDLNVSLSSHFCQNRDK
jgi:hypothetical protein